METNFLQKCLSFWEITLKIELNLSKNTQEIKVKKSFHNLDSIKSRTDIMIHHNQHEISKVATSKLQKYDHDVGTMDSNFCFIM